MLLSNSLCSGFFFYLANVFAIERSYCFTDATNASKKWVWNSSAFAKHSQNAQNSELSQPCIVNTLLWKQVKTEKNMFTNMSHNTRLIHNLLNSYRIICLLHKPLYTMTAANHQGRVEWSEAIGCSTPTKQCLMIMNYQWRMDLNAVI